MKAQMDEKVSARGQRDRNVKLGTGGIREIELVVQSLQAEHGKSIPELLERNTLRALVELRNRALIGVKEYDALHQAYLFLRDVENKLQMADDAQTHSLPSESAGVRACARLLGYAAEDPFLHHYRNHTRQVSRIFEKFVGR
jgi:glutamate-ammonia-ligase adenylyltransferase